MSATKTEDPWQVQRKPWYDRQPCLTLWWVLIALAVYGAAEVIKAVIAAR